MSKHKIVLCVLIATLSLTACNGGCSDNTTITADVSQSTSTEVAKEENETKVIDASENGTVKESGVSAETNATKPSEEGVGSEATTEASLEGSTSEETQGSTKPSCSSGSTSVKTTEAATKAQPVTTKASQTVTQTPAQPTTAAPKPTQTPAQPTTAAPKPTEAPTPAPTQAPKPTQAPMEAPTQVKPEYNPDYVIAETTRQLKELGYLHMPDVLNDDLTSGRITQEEYNAWYPTAGMGWFETTLYNVTFGLTLEDDVYEMVEGCKYLCKDYFYIEYVGENEYGGYTFRVYR